MSQKGYSKRIQNILKMIVHLSAEEGRPLTKQQLADRIGTNKRNIIEYKNDICNIELENGGNLFDISVLKGVHGGYVLNKTAGVSMFAISLFSKDDKNALYDAIQKAMVNKNFPYKNDILTLKNKVFSGDEWEYDYEHYLGVTKPEPGFEETIKAIKDAIISEKQIKLYFHFDENGKDFAIVDPYFIFHDEDESGLACYSYVKNDISNKARIYNIRNVKYIEVLNDREHNDHKEILSFIKNDSIKKAFKAVDKQYIVKGNELCKKIIGTRWDGSRFKWKEIGKDEIRVNITFSDKNHMDNFERHLK